MQLPITSNDLRKTLLGAELTELECNTLAQVCTVRHIASGEVLFREGESHHELYVILDGRLAVNKDSGRGFADTLHILSQGDLAGESGFLDGGRIRLSRWQTALRHSTRRGRCDRACPASREP